MMTSQKVHIVDDDANVRDSLACLLTTLNYQVITYENGPAFLAKYSRHEAECLILDLAMPQMSGRDLFTQIQQRHLLLPCIFLSGHATVSTAVDAIEQGAITFLVKPFDCDKLLKAVEKALQHCHDLRTHSTIRNKFITKLASLTPRQLEILKLMLKNCSIEKIANQLCRSVSTIEKHRMAVLEKLGFNHTQHLIFFCQQQGFNNIDNLLLLTQQS